MSASNITDSPTPEEILKDASRRMDMAIEFLRRDLQSVRTGRASPALVENLAADYYGVPHPPGPNGHYFSAGRPTANHSAL